MIAARLWGLDRAGELARRWGVPNLRASFPRHDRSDRHRVGSPNRALELALKAVLEASLSTKTDRLLRAGLSNATVPAWVDSDDDWKEINQGHDLTELQRHVDQNLDFIKMQPPSLPAEFAEAANFFKELEEGSPEGLRYSRVRPRQGANKNVLIASAVYGKNVDISRIGSLMRRIAGQHLPRSLTEGNTFYENLRAKGSEEYEALFNEISAVAQATTANVVKWKAINRHIKLWKCDAFGKWPIERNSYHVASIEECRLSLFGSRTASMGVSTAFQRSAPMNHDLYRFLSTINAGICRLEQKHLREYRLARDRQRGQGGGGRLSG